MIQRDVSQVGNLTSMIRRHKIRDEKRQQSEILRTVSFLRSVEKDPSHWEKGNELDFS